MEAAAKFNSPVIIQASNGGAQFMAGKSIKDKKGAAGEFGFENLKQFRFTRGHIRRDLGPRTRGLTVD